MIYRNKINAVRYQCLRCSKYRSRTCQHCHISGEEYGGEIFTPPPGVQSGSVRVIDDLVSYKSYPFDVLSDPCLKSMIQSRSLEGTSWYQNMFPEKILEPSITQCTACGGTNFTRLRSSRLHSFRASIYSFTEFLDGYDVFSKQCDACGKKFPFDGRKWGLLNFKDTAILPGNNS